MVNTKEIEKAIEKSKAGLSITDLVKVTTLSRGQIRTSLAFMLGARIIFERQTGMTKLYFLENEYSEM